MPLETVALPVPGQPEAPTTNTLDKDLQGSLRRSNYDFTRSPSFSAIVSYQNFNAAGIMLLKCYAMPHACRTNCQTHCHRAYLISTCRAQEVLDSLGIKSNRRFDADETNGKRKDIDGTEEAHRQQLQRQESGPHDALQPDQDPQEPNSKRCKNDSLAAADVSTAIVVVSPASTDVIAATGIAVCANAANGTASVEDVQPLKVFDVAWRLRNEVLARCLTWSLQSYNVLLS